MSKNKLSIAIINGPNLNLVGVREPSIYGHQSMEQFYQSLSKKYSELHLSYFQSNVEGELVNEIQRVGFSVQGIILNAGAYTHTSIALGDAVAAIASPTIELHISNVYAREDFRKYSYLSAKCVGCITGLGLRGYELAIDYLLKKDF